MGMAAKNDSYKTIDSLILSWVDKNADCEATTPSKVLLTLSRLFSQGAQPLIMLVHQLLQVAELTLSVLPQQICPPKDNKEIWGRENKFGIVILSVRELIREPSNKRFLKQQAEKIDMGTHSVIQWQATLRSRTTWLRNSVQQLPVVATNINRTHTQATKH